MGDPKIYVRARWVLFNALILCIILPMHKSFLGKESSRLEEGDDGIIDKGKM